MTTSPDTDRRKPGRRLSDRMYKPVHAVRSYHVLVVVVIALSFAGFLLATRPVTPNALPPLTHAIDPEPESHPAAPWYSEINMTGQAATVRLAAFSRTITNSAPPDSSLVAVMKQTSLQHRATRRAYNGAPPVIPHETLERPSAESCLACHESGAALGAFTVPRMSHARYENCLQCHAPASGLRIQGPQPAPNRFSGSPAPLHGQRAWQGAPPTLPHTTHMREQCLSCHGATAAPGLQTTHPERQSCLQCHALSALLEQAPNP